MTKTELMETYTAEQLAEMVVEKERFIEMVNEFNIFESIKASGLFDDPIKAYYETKMSICESSVKVLEKKLVEKESRINHLQSEVEKYRKAFEDAENVRDCQIAEYQNRTEKDKTELERAKNTINQIDDILEKLFGVRHDTVDKPDEFENILTDKAKGNATDFLSTEPIKVADMLINAKIEPVEISETGIRMVHKERNFDMSELKQIAEHLLVYCNHNGEVEE